MRNVQLHESHLLEAVRRRIVTSEQMEEVLALARANPVGGAIADVRWATVVQGLVAGAAVFGAGLWMAIETFDRHADLSLTLESLVVAAAMFGMSRVLGRSAYGRVPSSILLAGTAVCAFGAMAGVMASFVPSDAYTQDAEAWRAGAARLDFIAAISSAAVMLAGLGLWRLRRNGPALGVSGAAFILGAAKLFEFWNHENPSYARETDTALVLLGAGLAVYVAAMFVDRFARRAVDGAFWLFPVAMFPMGVAATIRIDHEAGEFFLWFPIALALGGIAYSRGRKLPLAFTAFATLFFPAFALAEAHGAPEAVAATVITSGVAIAVAAHHLRGLDLGRTASSEEPASIWS